MRNTVIHLSSVAMGILWLDAAIQTGLLSYWFFVALYAGVAQIFGDSGP